MLLVHGTALMPRDAGKTAFVLAGGGSLGAIQVGMLQELMRAGVRPDFVIGSSVGALNAAFFAGDPTPEGVAKLSSVWRRLRRRDVFPFTLSSAVSWAGPAAAFFNSARLRGLIERNLEYANLEDARVPLHVVATNLGGEAVRLSSGSVADAVLASAAIPAVFPAVEIGGVHLMDGALSGNTPILTAAELGATRLIVLPTGFACTLEGPPRGAVARGFHALTLLIARQMIHDLARLDGSIEVHTAPPLCPLNVSPFDFSQTEALISRAVVQTRAWLIAGGLRNQKTPPGLVPHMH
jgi:NTE family protein